MKMDGIGFSFKGLRHLELSRLDFRDRVGLDGGGTRDQSKSIVCG